MGDLVIEVDIVMAEMSPQEQDLKESVTGRIERGQEIHQRIVETSATTVGIRLNLEIMTSGVTAKGRAHAPVRDLRNIIGARILAAERGHL